MKLEYNQFDNGVRLIKLIGMLDLEGVNSVDRQFVEHCAGDAVFVLVDLARLTYLSSIGIPLLINVAKGVAARGGRLAFVNPQMNVKSVLEMTGVSHMIRTYPDVETGRSRIMSA